MFYEKRKREAVNDLLKRLRWDFFNIWNKEIHLTLHACTIPLNAYSLIFSFRFSVQANFTRPLIDRVPWIR